MSFAPMLPASGVIGFKLLTRTEDVQRQVFNRQPEIARDIAYFRENIAGVETAADLVADRRLLKVALGAFGMDDEIGKRAFLRRILEEGSEDPSSLANKLVDSRFVKFARSFGFGDILGARTREPGFAAEIANAYQDRQFEIAVGDQDESLRLALNFRREITAYAEAKDPGGSAWFSVMGDRPVRTVLEEAFGLPSSFGQLDIDKQRDVLRGIARREFGAPSLEVFSDPARVETVINRFLARRTAAQGPSPTTPGMAAVTILGGGFGGLGESGLRNLILS